MKHPFKNTINLKVQDDIKLNLEKEKLRQEIIALKRPLYKNPSFLTPLIGLLLGILTASFTVWSGLFDVKREKLENQKLVLQIEIDAFKKEKDSLTKQTNLYIYQSDSLSKENVILNNILKSSKEELNKEINKAKKDLQLKIESTKNEINKISSKFTLEKESIGEGLKEVNKLLEENNCNAAYSKLYQIVKKLNGITKGDFSDDFSDDFKK